ncbi:MAG: hypothetical protein AB7Q00_09255 [Phycisphaerales bacterium]
MNQPVAAVRPVRTLAVVAVGLATAAMLAVAGCQESKSGSGSGSKPAGSSSPASGSGSNPSGR